MGVNTSAIEKINEQIRMLEGVPNEEEYSNTDEVEVLEDQTIKIDNVDQIDTDTNIEVLDDEEIDDNTDDVSLDTDDSKDISEVYDKHDKEEEDTDITSTFLIYYIGVIFLAIFIIIVGFFLFK